MLTKDQDEKQINYMGLSELMRMIITFVTFCLNKKKSYKKKKSSGFQSGAILPPRVQLAMCQGILDCHNCVCVCVCVCVYVCVYN